MTDPKQDVRQQFEKEAAILGLSLERWPTGQSFRDGSAKDYYEPTETAWWCYQAALQSPAVRELVEDARRYAFLRDDPPVELAVRKRESSKRDGLSYLYIDGPQLDNEIDTALRTLGAGHVE